MTQTTIRPAWVQSDRVRLDNYDDVTEMLVALHTMAVGSREHAQQRERIFARCLPLADNVAKHFVRRGVPVDDITQIARLGLVNAVNRFDPAKGAHFVGFAVPTMMGEVRRYFRDHCWGLRVPRRLRELHVQIGKATTPLTQRLGRSPTASELAEVLEVPRDEIIECLVAGDAYRPSSLDAPTGDSDQARTVEQQLGSIDLHLEHIDDRLTLAAVIHTLPDRDRQILHMRFFQSMTQSEIAERIGCSQMQISRILAQTLQVLRDRLN
jgi:RNA polymerase sigma-B factor